MLDVCSRLWASSKGSSNTSGIRLDALPRPRDELALDCALADLRRRGELAMDLELDGALAGRPRGGEKYEQLTFTTDICRS